MKFLYPQFLYALTTLVIPIVIHLFNFRKYKTVYFSNISFLKSVKERTKAQSQLKHLLILLSRMLAFTAIIMAFAQPYIPSKSDAKAIKKHAVSIFIDNSFSMDAENTEGKLFNQAQNKALEIAEAYENTDEFQYLDNNFKGNHQRIINKEDFLNHVNQLEISSNSNTISQIVKRQVNSLKNSNADRKEIYIVSDFQESISDLEELKVDSNYFIRLVPLTPFETANIYLDSCWLNSPNIQIEKNNKLFVRIKNSNKEMVEGLSVKLEIEGQQKAIATTNVLDEEIVMLNFTVSQTGWKNANIKIQDYPITFDDQLFISIQVKEALDIQSIYQDKPHPSLENIYGSDTYFNYSSQSVNQLNHSQILANSLIILDGLQQISSGLSSTLLTHLDNGGSILLFPPTQLDKESYDIFCQELQIDTYQGFNNNPLEISSINKDHQLFEGVFEKVDQKLNYPQIKQHHQIASSTNKRAQYLMQYVNKSSMLNDYSSRNGKIYLSTVGLSESFGNFTKHALFVPILYNIASYSGGKQALSFNTEQTSIQLNIPKTNQETYTISNEELEFIPDARQYTFWIYDQIKNAGHYDLKNKDAKIAKLSFNYNRMESNPTVLSERFIKDFASNYQNIEVIKSSTKNITSTINNLNNGTSLWLICIVLCLVFLAIETLLIRLL